MLQKNLLFPLVFIVLLFMACKEKTKPVALDPIDQGKVSSIKYANGFSIENNGSYTVVEVYDPWPGAQKSFTYAFIPQEKLAVVTYPRDAYDAVVVTPVEKIVATSTTHIPALESLGALDKLVGFPDTEYVSSVRARELISEGKIRELGNNESLNTEMVIALQPDVIVGFGIDNQNSPYELLQKANIPVIFNGDWTEQTPLGKAEWIKFFGVLLNKEKKADSLFTQIESSYLSIKDLAKESTNTPTVLSGALYKDVWYLPAGDSWAAQFLNDAHADYLYKETEGTGSLSLSLESVLDKGRAAEFWVSPSQFTSYEEMEKANKHYLEFQAFKNQKVYTFAGTKGATGGLLYYELGPQRPDLVLKDLVHIFHPQLLPNHTPYFFTPLQ